MSKVMISLAPEFLQDVNAIAKAEHRSRSELVREAIRTSLATRTGLAGGTTLQSHAAQRAAARILATRIRWPKGQTAETLVRTMREARYGSNGGHRH